MVDSTRCSAYLQQMVAHIAAISFANSVTNKFSFDQNFCIRKSGSKQIFNSTLRGVSSVINVKDSKKVTRKSNVITIKFP